MNEMTGSPEVPMPEAAPEVTPEAHEAPMETAAEPPCVESTASLAETHQSDITLAELPEAPPVEVPAETAPQAGMEEGIDEIPEAPEVEVSTAQIGDQAEEVVDEVPEPPPVEAAVGEPEPETAEPPVEYPTVREALLDNVDDETLRNHADALYREGATTGDGGTAAALFHEKETGDLVRGKSHEPKADQRERGLGHLIEDGELNTTDREIAQDLREDLANALEAERR